LAGEVEPIQNTSGHP